MLPSLTVQISDESPQVLLVGSTNTLTHTISKFFEERSLSVLKLNPTKISTFSVPEFLYKVVWIIDIETFSSDELSKVKDITQTLTIPLVIIVPVKTVISEHYSYPEWSVYSKKQGKVIADLAAAFVTVHFIFIENIIDVHDEFSMLKYFTHTVQQQNLADPVLALPLLTVDVAVKAIEEPLFRPGFHQSMLVKGQEVSSETVLSRVQQHYHHIHKLEVEIKNIPVQTTPLVSFTVEEKIVAADIEPALVAAVRRLPKVTLQSENSSIVDTALPKPTFSRNATINEAPRNEVLQETVTPSDESASTPEETIVTEQAEQKQDVVVDFESEKDVQQELQRIFAHNRTESKTKRVVHIAEVEDKIVKKSRHKKILFWGGLGVVGGGMSLLSLLLSFYLSTLLVKQGLVSIVQATSNSQTKVDWKRLDLATQALAFQTDKYTLFIDSSLVSQSAELVSLSQNVQKLYQSSEQTSKTTTQSFQQIMNGGGQSSEIFSSLQAQAKENHEVIAAIQEQIEMTDFNTQGSSQEQALQDFKRTLSEKAKAAGVIQQLAPLLPHLTGVDQPRTYAVILQNNQELRPTGGFIQSVALISLTAGTITDTEFLSSYDLDAQLSGTVTPPEEVKQLLGEERWYLRDSNWDPDFTNSAEKIATFIENSSTKKVDGVIAIDIYGLEKVLQATGPLNLPQYNEVITAENIAERLEFHSEVTFIDKEKNPDYSTVLFSALFSSIRTLQQDEILKLFVQLQSMTKENNMLISLRDQNENMSVKSLGWSGSIISPDCPSALGQVDCFVDSIAQVEANIGINKANYYLERSINHSVTLSPTLVSHKRTITYRNKAQTNTWPKGNYKSYVRLYLPTTINLKSVYFNTSPIPTDQISVKEEHNRKVIGFLIDVPINSQSIVDIEYDEVSDKALPYSYAFFEQKQPGTPITPFTLTVVPPAGAQPVLIAPEAQVHSQTVLFQEEQKTHLFYGVQFE